MASNTTLNPGASGDIITTKERTHDGDATKQQGVFLSGVTGTEGSYTFTDVTAGGGTEATALRVTIASDSTGVLSVDDNGGSLTVDGTVAATQSGTWNIGSITTLPTLANVTTLGTITNAVTVVGSAAEDAAASGNPVLIGGRYDSSARTLETGDAGALAVNASGQLLVEIAAGAGSGGTAAADDADFTAGTTSATPVMGVYQSTPTNVTDGDMGIVGITQDRLLKVSVAGGGISGQVDDAAMTLGTKEGIPIVGSYSATRDLLDTGDGGIVALSARRAQYIIGDTVISTANSSTANLAGAAAFTGTSEDVSDFTQIQVSVFSSHASATDGLSLQQSSNGTNWDIVDTYTIPATTGRTISLPVQAQFFRLVYTNGGTLTTSLRIQTMFKAIPAKGSSQRPSDATSNENDFEMVSGFLHGFNGTTWDRLRSVNTGYLGVTPHFAGTASATNTGAASAQTQRVVTATDSTIGTVTTVTNITNQGQIADDAAFTPATTRVNMAGFFADETATDSVDEGDGGAARMTLDRKQITTAYAHAAAGGCTPYKNLDVDETEDDIKTSAGKLFFLHVMNLHASATRYLKIYNNVAASVTVGTTVPDLTFPIPANTNGFVVPLPSCGLQFTTGICIAATTGFADNDTGAPGANEVIVNAGYL